MNDPIVKKALLPAVKVVNKNINIITLNKLLFDLKAATRPINIDDQ